MNAVGNPVGNVIGGPVGVARATGRGFNEVLAVYSQQVILSTSSTIDIPIPFSYASPAELDAVVFLSTHTQADSNAFCFSGDPTGLAARFGWGSAGDSTNYRTIQLLNTGVLRMRTFGTATFNGRVQILKRNRRVRAWALLPAAATEALLPFAIKDPRKTLVTLNATTSAGAQSAAFANEFFDVGDSASWHLATALVDARVRLTSPSTYITSSSSLQTTLTEFE